MLVERLAALSNLDVDTLVRIAEKASQRYKIYTIPKRTGGDRVICHPNRETKALQRWFNKALFDRFPVHDAATAYRVGAGIKVNAIRHLGTRYTNRYDFANFFPSFEMDRIAPFIQSESEKLGIKLSDLDMKFIGNVVCRYGRLTIGAPSSPVLTNALMFEFDSKLGGYCESNGLIYSRYADDLFVSSFKPGKLENLVPKIQKYKRESSHLNLRLNLKKTAYLSKKSSRVLAGVVLTSDNQISVGRARKKEVKSLVYEFSKGELKWDKIEYLQGLLAFCFDIEPDLRGRLSKKYGLEVITKLERWHLRDSFEMMSDFKG